MCMFCQKSDSKNMRNVMTMGLSEKILSMTERDLVMRVRLSNISDLVASEGKYHIQCWVQFQRKVAKVKPGNAQKRDHCLDRLC